ncbi:beta-N-acetylhexosaminidase [Aquisalimonas asiatica]|uniref:Beta-hexosaminidase n=1 Tax=Aquisalimonas asiatica TaxID=406100 RepID=A0A1H8QA93_9GAMM|nr:beta-N-acetylhexosaminidase [Aquisalimonas asiatica]SEO50827.1 beta-N-acetylhexosaminidase [Aquisalimonas asiatica]
MTPGGLMIGVRGAELTAEERELLAHPRVVGVILFTRNFESWDQLCALTAAIHRQGEPAPIVAVDQEGGRVQRFREPCTVLPPARLIGARHDQDDRTSRHWAREMAWLMAAELRAAGVDLSFAPVLDLDRGFSSVIGDRALHGDPDSVAELATAWTEGMRAAGMAATGKHFPGHGGVSADSHLDLPVDDRPVLALRGEDLVPFERLVESGGLDAVMTAHVVYSDMDNQPATFSRQWIQNTLRQELGFEGVVVGDDLGMEGAASIGDYPERAESAVDAGCDLIMLCNELDAIPGVLDALGAEVDPQTQRRLAMLQPGAAPASSLEALHATDRWVTARRVVDDIAASATDSG